MATVNMIDADWIPLIFLALFTGFLWGVAYANGAAEKRIRAMRESIQEGMQCAQKDN